MDHAIEAWTLVFTRGFSKLDALVSPVCSRATARIFLVLALAFPALLGCSGNAATPGPGASRQVPNAGVLRLATTTSVRDSGLLDELLPTFEKMHECRVDVIAVGSGAALRLGEAGDVDAVVVHDREAEEAFIEANHGVRHEEFMVNEFVLLGPHDDPAQIRGLDPIESLKRIADAKQPFISRGDNSGTHERELSLWRQADVQPQWDAYLESGQGMGPTLTMADEKAAYVLADVGTYLHFKGKIDLVPLAASAESMGNPYAAIVVNPEKHEKVRADLANALVDFLISDEAQRLIAGYEIGGRQLFRPTRLDGGG